MTVEIGTYVLPGTKYVMHVTAIKDGVVHWDGYYGSGYDTPLDQFQKFLETPEDTSSGLPAGMVSAGSLAAKWTLTKKG